MGRLRLEDTRHGANGSNGNGELRYCDCDELITGGKRIPAPANHDCAYTTSIGYTS
jgi:hypothetical protein